ncbi:carbamate kinase [Nitrospina gracilis]|uniref:carbamate kinase n=1 Tax=Nitrospina gracilis TaxID=35801 RepID=UPI001F165ED0|nr:carbamate kinase [Nitrospina gracilis]MCF8721131.1 carbamate kinase [Nitrospina gracilis Nb-211]
MSPSSAKPSLLIAFGGNALNIPGDHKPIQKEEFIIARRSMEQVVPLLKQGYGKIILTHGNGPQVGQIFLQQELTVHEIKRQVTLDVCVADSQGRIGYILQNVFDNVCRKHGIDQRCISVITQVVVDPNDPGFQHPTKPIGVFYSEEEARRLEQERGWVLKEDAGRGWRRLIPSPRPLEIVEQDLFHRLLDMGIIAIGAGGGGVPVVRNADGSLDGIEAVIDKDHTSALLGASIGIETLIILTQVPCVYRDFNTPAQRPITEANVEAMETLLNADHFAEGSMKPKVEAAIHFLKRGGRKVIIAHLNDLQRAVEGEAGTQIVP